MLKEDLVLQRKFISENLKPELDKFRKNADKSLNEKDFKKIESYYAFGVPAILGENFCRLIGKDFNLQERYALSYLGGISGLLDDIFDEKDTIPENYKTFVDHPEKLNPSNNFEELLQSFYLKGLENASCPVEVKQRANLVFDSQLQSLQQKYITNLKLQKKICFYKGGAAFMYYRQGIDHPIDASEEIFLNHLGGLMQLANDIFDLWEDRELGIETVATLAPNSKSLKKLFLEELNLNLRLSENLNFNAENIKMFNQVTRLGLSRVFVCFSQYRHLEKKYQKPYNEIKGERHEFICDMEKTSNKILSVRYYLQH